MTLTVLDDLLQGSEEWHDQRRGIVTASVVGRLVGLRALTGIDYTCPECGALPDASCLSKVKRDGEPAPIKTLHQGRVDTARRSNAPPRLEVSDGDDARGLTALLVAERITGHTDPIYVSDDMLRGHEDEPRARDLYSEHYAEVRESGFMVRRETDWTLGYSPDGLVGDDGLIEVKSRRQKKQLTTILTDEVPVENMAQLQAGLLVSGREWCDYISYCGGMPMYVKRVYPEHRWFAAIVDAVVQFEEAAADMIAKYQMLTQELPMTERVIEMDMIL